MDIRYHLFAGLAFVCMIFQVPAMAQPSGLPSLPADEILIGPVSVVSEVSGVPLRTTVTSYFSVGASTAGLRVRERIFADLRDLQAKIGTLVNTIPLPTDNCTSYSANNPVVRIFTKQLSYANVVFSDAQQLGTTIMERLGCGR